MRTYLALLRREWLQHRLGWSLALALPYALVLLVAAFAQVHVDAEQMPARAADLGTLAALAAMTGTTLVVFIIGAVTSLIIVSGLARRDHADRSVEFWLSLPVGHGASLGVPLFTHLMLVPAAAIVIGWLGGQLLSLLVVGRMAGVDAWLALPWPQLLAASLALAARLLAGLPLAVLWVLPIVLVLVLLGAWFKRWGWIVLVVGLGLLSLLGQLTIGPRWIVDSVGVLLRRAGQALLGAGGRPLTIGRGSEGLEVLRSLPGLAWRDFTAALGALPSPWLLGGLIVAAGCFWLLVRWRERGAGIGD
jgi:hypothetical protein